MGFPGRAGRSVGAVALAFAVWLPTLRYAVDLVRPAPGEVADAVTADLAEPWPAREREINPEWDFMARTYLVLALSNEALARPDRAEGILARVDAVIARTLAEEADHGHHFFLLPYSRAGEFRDIEARSLFVDGEIAMVIAARLLVAPDPRLETELRSRTARIEASLRRGPLLSAESYPNECWTFCNTTALAALAMSDAVLGEDHGPLLRHWVAVAKERLIDERTGLLVSSYTWDGHHLDGPEGSSLWMSAHNLLLVDPEFARAQFDGAREELAQSTLGFAWAREWPEGSDAYADVDSGPVVPLLDASPGSSGLALLGATAFGDEDLRDGLLRSLEFAAFPADREGRRRYEAAGRIGNAVVVYALRFGPLWERAGHRAAHPRELRL